MSGKDIFHETPVVTDVNVIPVAGRDSMLLNLSGAHDSFFTSSSLKTARAISSSAKFREENVSAKRWGNQYRSQNLKRLDCI